ncbi:MAG: protein translocase subunit SecD, partial [Bacteriovoracaceae bacterium]
MTRGWWFRFGLLAFLVVLALAGTAPSFFNMKEDGAFPFKKKIALGLDLQGGLYMVLGIDFNKVYRDEVTTYTRKAVQSLKAEGIEASFGKLDTSDSKDPKHSLVVANSQDLEKARDKVKQMYGYPLRITKEEGTTLTYGLGRDYLREIEDSALSKSIEVIRNRIDEFGVSEPEILSQGTDRIVVQLPGVKDINRAKDLIGKTAKLEFKIVNDQISGQQIGDWMAKIKNAGIEFKKGERFSEYLRKVNDFLRADLPAGYEIAFSKETNKNNDITKLDPFLVESTAALTGEELQEAFVRIDQENNSPYVALEFKPTGAKLFEEVTGNNTGKLMAIVLDGNVYSAPQIRGKIAGGSAQITLGRGNYESNMREARDLALVLRAGALPVELVFEEQRVVGPSLGADAIDKAQMASIIGSLIVFIFMMIYYRLSGFIACITILVNVLFTIGILIAVDATLSLPGIAGIALT